MKVLVVLALAVAVAQAGFSGSLVKQAQPHLQSAINGIKADLAAKVPARNSAEAGFQTQFVDALSNHAQNILSQIESAVTTAQETAQEVVSALHAAVSQIQGLGSNAVQNAQQILSTLWNTITGSLGFDRGSRALPAALQAIVHQVAQNPQFIAMVHSSEAYKCLKRGGITVTLEYLQGLSQAGQLNAGLLEDPVIAGCVEEAGGLHALISGSEIVNWAQNFAAQLGITDVIHNIILDVVGAELGGLIIDALQNRHAVMSARALSPAMQAIVIQVATNPEFVALVHASPAYICLKSNGITVTLEYIQTLNANGLLNAGLLDDPVISKCVEESGGLHALIAESEIVDHVQAMIQPLGLTGMIHQIIIDVVGEELGNLIVDALSSRNGRGFFGDAWNTISGVASNAWDNLTDSVASVGQYIAQVATATWQSAAEKFEIIKQLAQAVVQGGLHAAQVATQQAAQELINTLSIYATDLGNLYTQIVGEAQSIWNGITVPSWQSRVKAF